MEAGLSFALCRSTLFSEARFTILQEMEAKTYTTRWFGKQGRSFGGRQESETDCYMLDVMEKGYGAEKD